MRREHWFLVAGVALGLLLGGARCSLRITQDGKPAASITTGQSPAMTRNPTEEPES